MGLHAHGPAYGASHARAWRLGSETLLVARRGSCITWSAWLLCWGAERADPVEQRQQRVVVQLHPKALCHHAKRLHADLRSDKQQLLSNVPACCVTWESQQCSGRQALRNTGFRCDRRCA